MKPLDLLLPEIEPPYIGEDLLTETLWQPYPMIEPTAMFHSLSLNDERFRLYAIAADLLPIVLSGNPEDSPLPGHAILDVVAKLDRLRDIDHRLLDWYRDLPLRIQVEANGPSPPAGPQVDLQ
jgi:hypothetical protein